MGPPREHGGMPQPRLRTVMAWSLQWGRRVNTAECALVGVSVVLNSDGFNGAAA